MAITTADVKLYLRVDGTTEDTLIASLVTAAQKFIQQQTGKTQAVVNDVEVSLDSDELYVLAVKRLVARMYEQRGDNLPASAAKEDPTVQMLINHIALSGEYV